MYFSTEQVEPPVLNWVPEGNLAGICWVGFCGLCGPWGLQNHPKMWGASPPTFLEGCKAPRGCPDPKKPRFSAKLGPKTPLNESGS